MGAEKTDIGTSERSRASWRQTWQVGQDGELVEDPAEQRARERILRAGGAILRRFSKILSADAFQISHVGVDRVLRQDSERATAIGAE